MMKLLCFVCLSDNSLDAMEYAIAMGEKLKAELKIIHISDESESFKDYALKKRGIRMAKMFEIFNFIEVLKTNSVDELIISVASESQPDLILMSSLAYNDGEGKFFISECTSHVIIGGDYPVLMVPPEKVFTDIKKVALATDMSENNVQIMHQVIRFLKNFHPDFTMLYFTDEVVTWHYQSDISRSLDFIKAQNNYLQISANVLDSKDLGEGVENFLNENHVDVLCVDAHHKFFDELLHQNHVHHMALCSHVPILALPEYWKDPLKGM